MTTTTNNTETNPTIDSLSNALSSLWRVGTATVRVAAKSIDLTVATTAAIIESVEVGADVTIAAVPKTPEEVEAQLQSVLADLTTNTTNKLTTK